MFDGGQFSQIGAENYTFIIPEKCETVKECETAGELIQKFRKLLLAYENISNDRVNDIFNTSTVKGKILLRECDFMKQFHAKYSRILDISINTDPKFQALSPGAKRMYLLIIDKKGELLKKAQFLEVSDNLQLDREALDDFLQSTSDCSFISIKGRGYRYAEKSDNESFQIAHPEIIREETQCDKRFSSLNPSYIPPEEIMATKCIGNQELEYWNRPIKEIFEPGTYGYKVFKVFLSNPNKDITLDDLSIILRKDKNKFVSPAIHQIMKKLNKYNGVGELKRLYCGTYRYFPNVEENNED